MPRPAKSRTPATSPFTLPNNKVTITPVGMQVTGELSFEECYAALRSKAWPAFMKMLESSDAQEGAKAFVEKRPPEWKRGN